MKIFIFALMTFSSLTHAGMFMHPGQKEYVITCHPTYPNELIRKQCYKGSIQMGGPKTVKCTKGPYKGCCYRKMSGSTTADFVLTKDCKDAINPQ